MKTRIVLTILWGLTALTVAKLSDNLYLTKFSNIEQLESLSMLALKISICSCFWVFILTRNDMVFGWIKRLLIGLGERYIYKDGKPDLDRMDLVEYVLKPLITCEVCVGGNVAFWTYVAISRKDFIVIDLLFLISFTGLITLLTTETWQRIAK